MKKENKVISLPLAKRIHALGGLKGVESEWWWVDFSCEGNFILHNSKPNNRDTFEHYPAYDIAELGE